jgi:hypothetical protein
MCVIIHAVEAKPTADELLDASLTNADGGGVMWPTKNGLIAWRKGLDVDQVIALVETLPLPFGIHFRIATHGHVSHALTHPFPVTSHAGITTDGESKHALMHNGIWNDYQRHVGALKGAKTYADQDGQVYLQDVSDSRIMAAKVYQVGPDRYARKLGKIAKSGQRLLLAGPDGFERYGDWRKGTGGDTTKGCYYSNVNHCWGLNTGWHGHGNFWSSWDDYKPSTKTLDQKGFPDWKCQSCEAWQSPQERSYIVGSQTVCCDCHRQFSIID